MLEYFDFDPDEAERLAREIQPEIEILRLSAKTGEGIDAWLEFLESATRSDDWPRDELERLQVRILGVVQGVGFRPFVYRLAGEEELPGWVRNDGNGVTHRGRGRARPRCCAS